MRHAKDQLSEEKIKKALEDTVKTIDEEKIKRINREIPDKLEGLDTSKSFLQDLKEKVKLLFVMVNDKEYKLKKEHKLIFLGALLYFLLPVDLIADYIPGLGFLDDALVLKMVWKSFTDEIETYKSLRL
ncbi:MAG: hypothetical protein Kow00108_08330 [Calditrichia bacterium]